MIRLGGRAMKLRGYFQVRFKQDKPFSEAIDVYQAIAGRRAGAARLAAARTAVPPRPRRREPARCSHKKRQGFKSMRREPNISQAPPACHGRSKQTRLLCRALAKYL